MSTINNGLPSLIIQFKAAAAEVSSRSKRGFVGLILRDSKAPGIHIVRDEAGIPKDLGVENQAAIKRALMGSDRGKPSRIVLSIMAPETESTGNPHLHTALTDLSGQVLDYIAGPGDMTETESQIIADWVLDQRKLYRPVKAVLPNEAADHMGVINFATEGIKVDTTPYTAAQYCGRIAGILAGIPSDSAATYVTLPEVSSIPILPPDQQTAAINAGKLILLHDGQKAKLARAVNSLVTIPADGKADWTKIKIVEGMDLVTYFARTTIEDAWLGQYSNSYDNKMLLVVALQTFLAELEAAGVLVRGSSFADLDLVEQETYLRSVNVDTAKLTDQQLREADTGAMVFLQAGGRFLDAMEDFRLTFNNL